MKHILIINNAPDGINDFVEPIKKILDLIPVGFYTVNYSACLTINFSEIDSVIMSGSPQGNDIVDGHLPFFLWLKTFQLPVLGICAGHHITGVLYGAELLRSKEPESGDFMVDIIKQDPILNGMGSFFKVKQMHNDSITLPPEFELLVSSETCFNQLMKHKEKPLYTCQFHPEYFNPDLIRNFVELIVSDT